MLRGVFTAGWLLLLTMTEPLDTYLTIQPPQGDTFTLCLTERTHCTLGRATTNDLCLPDPQKFISREHCRLEKINGYWWVIDDDNGASRKPSASGTFLFSIDSNQEINIQENGRERLHNGDYFYIVAQILDDDVYQYWTFTFHDSEETTQELPSRPRLKGSSEAGIFYSLSTKTLVKASGEILSLPKLPTKLIRFMAQKNYARNHQATPCRFREMIEAVWEGEDGYGKHNSDITHLVWQIRKKIEADPANPHYIQNLMADGYILHIPIKP